MKRPCDSDSEVEDGILLGSMIAIVYVQLSSTHWTSTILDKFFPTVEIMIGGILFWNQNWKLPTIYVYILIVLQELSGSNVVKRPSANFPILLTKQNSNNQNSIKSFLSKLA